jgi:hypothetical protein
MTGDKSFKRVICLPKSGSSFLARILSRHNAVHEYDFITIAHHALQMSVNKHDAQRYLFARQSKLENSIDISTTLVFFLREDELLSLSPQTIFLVRSPFEWVASMIKYAYKTHSISELDQDSGWRLQYGKLFINDVTLCRQLLGNRDKTRQFIAFVSHKLLWKWVVMTQLLFDSAAALRPDLTNIFLTHKLSSIDSYERISDVLCIKGPPPLSLFLKVNDTTDDLGIVPMLAHLFPTLNFIKIDSPQGISIALMQVRHLLSTFPE